MAEFEDGLRARFQPKGCSCHCNNLISQRIDSKPPMGCGSTIWGAGWSWRQYYCHMKPYPTILQFCLVLHIVSIRLELFLGVRIEIALRPLSYLRFNLELSETNSNYLEEEASSLPPIATWTWDSIPNKGRPISRVFKAPQNQNHWKYFSANFYTWIKHLPYPRQ